MRPGKFITLEGGEGAGKSTQAKRLGDYLASLGKDVVVTRELGGAPGAEKIRKIWLEEGEGFWDPLADLMLIFAARREHLTKTILPALKRGAWVVSDRFMDSTRAYQGLGRNPELRQIERLYKEIAGTFEPDLTILLDVPVAKSMQRVRRRGGWIDRYELKKPAFHRALRSTYLALARKHKKRIKLVDAGKDLDEVAASVAALVVHHFKLAAPK